ncbi:hypothetical protein IOD13_19250 [Brevibacterium casei]|nr:hypothetical protein [Brevibacterium casei]
MRTSAYEIAKRHALIAALPEGQFDHIIEIGPLDPASSAVPSPRSPTTSPRSTRVPDARRGRVAGIPEHGIDFVTAPCPGLARPTASTPLSSPRPATTSHPGGSSRPSTRSRSRPATTSFSSSATGPGRSRTGRSTPRRSTPSASAAGRMPFIPHHDVGDYRLDVLHISPHGARQRGGVMIDHTAIVVPAHNEEAEIPERLTALVAAVEAASTCPRCRSSPSPTDAPTAPRRPHRALRRQAPHVVTPL